MSALEGPSALEQAQNLRKRADDLLRDARANALERAGKAVAELNALGFAFKLLEDDKRFETPRDRFHYRVVDINKSQPSTCLETALKLAQHLTQEQRGREYIVEKVERVWPHAPA